MGAGRLERISRGTQAGPVIALLSAVIGETGVMCAEVLPGSGRTPFLC